jgi:hypothetical protein
MTPHEEAAFWYQMCILVGGASRASCRAMASCMPLSGPASLPDQAAQHSPYTLRAMLPLYFIQINQISTSTRERAEFSNMSLDQKRFFFI